MRRPSSIWIVSKKYKIRFVANLAKHSLAVGMFRWESSEILIDDGLKGPGLAETLLHEILHAVHVTCNLQTGVDEEDIVSRLTPILLDVIRNGKNQKFWKWWKELDE